MNSPKLFMLLIGCKPKGRHTEQHDIYFGIAQNMKELIPQLHTFWPETNGKMHIDAYREVTEVNGYAVAVVPSAQPVSNDAQLFFINLGGYKQHEFEEFHYKMIIAAPDKSTAIQQAKQTAFYQHTGFEGANSHIDDKYGVDVDDIFEIEEILSSDVKSNYKLHITKATETNPTDELYLGYFKLSSFE
jgi:hypothetical protein